MRARIALHSNFLDALSLEMRDDARPERADAKPEPAVESNPVRRAFGALSEALRVPNTSGRLEDDRLDKALLAELGAAPRVRIADARDARRPARKIRGE